MKWLPIGTRIRLSRDIGGGGRPGMSGTIVGGGGLSAYNQWAEFYAIQLDGVTVGGSYGFGIHAAQPPALVVAEPTIEEDPF